jgi:oligopeptide transport system ATP-binding protein
MPAVLDIEALSVDFPKRRISAVREVSLSIAQGECLGIVGESGSGKTQVFMAALGLLPKAARAGGSVRFEGRQILGLPRTALNRIRGSRVAMIFQDPMSPLTPHLRIGTQLAEVLVCHRRSSWKESEQAAGRMLGRLGLPEPERRLRQYPHELSGGMRQRVMIAMSLLCEPALVIADEPTTALDVTVQAQIIDLLRSVRQEFGTAIALISHDVEVVAALADRILVMYAGRVVESASAGSLLREPRHPYTAELLRCVPNLSAPRQERMPSLAGQPPDAARPAIGCEFAPRCRFARDRCLEQRPELADVGAGTLAACHFPLTP